MNTSKPNSPPKKPQPPQVPRVLGSSEEQMTMLTAHCLQLERVIWLMAAKHGAAVEVDEAGLNPLWTTRYDRVPGAAQTMLKITATQLPEPTDGQIVKLAELLAGQPEEATPSALLQVGMSGYPPSYVCGRLAPLVVCRDGKWAKV